MSVAHLFVCLVGDIALGPNSNQPCCQKSYSNHVVYTPWSAEQRLLQAAAILYIAAELARIPAIVCPIYFFWHPGKVEDL